MSEHSDDRYMPGSDSYEGHCPDCGTPTYTNYNEQCEDCYDETHPEETSDEEADQFVSKFNERIDMRELANEILSNINSICTDFKNKI